MTLWFALLLGGTLSAQSGRYLAVTVYEMGDASGAERTDRYLSDAMLPALKRNGIREAGVFQPWGDDTAAVKKVFLIHEVSDLYAVSRLQRMEETDTAYRRAAADFLSVRPAPFLRRQTMLVETWAGAPLLTAPRAVDARAERVYELRSYEGPNDERYDNKVAMFEAGGEIALFDRLGFGAVFYGTVIAGPRMPNLMYMTTFDNRAARDEHWKSFSNAPEWKALSSDPQYKDNVSRIDIWLLRAKPYSDF